MSVEARTISIGPVARDVATAPFFDGTARGEFLIRCCGANNHALEPQAEQCPKCGSTDLGWVVASGEAKLVSWAISYGRPKGPGQKAPWRVVAIGELSEGPWWWTQIVGARPEELRAGMPLKIDFERSGDHESVPVFRPA